MAALRIHLFGTVRITRDDDAAGLKVTRMAQALLAYLVLYPRLHSREALCGLLWGDHTESQARGCLRTNLWRLRRTLEPENAAQCPYLVATPTGEVGFNQSSDHWVDIDSFQAGVRPVAARSVQPIEPGEVEGLENAIDLYTGDLLEGFYDDWALQERERFRCMYLQALTCLMHYHGAQGDPEKSAAHGREILKHDPLREEVHRHLMRLHAVSGRRAEAVRQYEACRRVMREELGIEPMEETTALNDQIVKAGGGRNQAGTVIERPPAGLQQAVLRLRAAVEGFEKAQTHLVRAVELVEWYSAREEGARPTRRP